MFFDLVWRDDDDDDDDDGMMMGWYLKNVSFMIYIYINDVIYDINDLWY